MNWFSRLTGFDEGARDTLRANLSVEGEVLVSQVNQRHMAIGKLETPTLAALRARLPAASGEKLRLTEVVANVQDLYRDPANAGALFQVASQFNLLEMTGPKVRPEDGVTRYEDDLTQGPASAISCGAATIYRNYFVPLEGQIGQTEDCQIDCLADIDRLLDNKTLGYWFMRNGYVLSGDRGATPLSNALNALTAPKRDELRDHLRIGVQSDCEVTLGASNHRVSQAFCSAIPVAYDLEPSSEWEPFARLVLDAGYEASLAAAVLNHARTGNPVVFLTLVGGGVFGNPHAWINDAILRALRLFADRGLDVRLVSYRTSNPAVTSLIEAADQQGARC